MFIQDMKKLPHHCLWEKKVDFQLLRKLCAQPAFNDDRANIRLNQSHVEALLKNTYELRKECKDAHIHDVFTL